MEPSTLLYPMPAVLVGANVDARPNFMTVAWCGIANSEPPMVSVAIRRQRHTHRGITQNQTFSINVPGTDLIREVDYCGMVSGARVNKAEACKFTVLYGKLGSAPLIDQCPVNLECQVEHALELGSHSLFVGRVVETHVSESCVTDGNPDVDKIKPFVFTTSPALQYRAFGEPVGKAFNVGREMDAE
jgi:flavin reductase (DIM6/NTAB) family NADH-FMN oxidoreductase RutF